MKISAYNSQKIKILSFIAIMMVLYTHSVYTEAKEIPVAQYIQEFCAFGGLSVAIPLFYCISGFLFFLGMQHVGECYPKIRKRARTLLVPYLIWNIIFVLWYVVLGIIPGISKYVNSDANGYFGNGPLHTLYALYIAPAGFQLWYVRDLIIYVLLSPLIYHMLKKFKCGFPVVLFVAGSLGLIYLPSEIKVWGAFFFVLGGYVALHSSLDEIHDKIKPSFAYLCLVIYLLNAIIRPLGIIQLAGIGMVIELCGLLAIWRLYDEMSIHDSKLSAIISNLSTYTFFIYLFHEPAFNIIKKLGLKILGVHDWSLILLYLVNPWIMAAVAIAVAMIFKKLLPKVYYVCVGGR